MCLSLPTSLSMQVGQPTSPAHAQTKPAVIVGSVPHDKRMERPTSVHMCRNNVRPTCMYISCYFTQKAGQYGGIRASIPHVHFAAANTFCRTKTRTAGTGTIATAKNGYPGHISSCQFFYGGGGYSCQYILPRQNPDEDTCCSKYLQLGQISSCQYPGLVSVSGWECAEPFAAVWLSSLISTVLLKQGCLISFHLFSVS